MGSKDDISSSINENLNSSIIFDEEKVLDNKDLFKDIIKDVNSDDEEFINIELDDNNELKGSIQIKELNGNIYIYHVISGFYSDGRVKWISHGNIEEYKSYICELTNPW